MSYTNSHWPGCKSSGLSVRINLRASGLRVETLEHVLFHVRLALDEIDLAVRALKKPQVAVAGNVDQTFNCPAAAFVVDQDRRRDLVPVPGFVGGILVVTLDLAGGGIDRDR